MEISVKYKNIQGTFNLVFSDGTKECSVGTNLDKEGVKLMSEKIQEFIDDAIWDVIDFDIETYIDALDVVLYKHKNDDDPITETFWFSDYIIDDSFEDDDIGVSKFKDRD